MGAMAIVCGVFAALAAAAPMVVQDVDAAMTGGGRVAIRSDGQVLDVTVTGPRAGLASLCVSDGSRVRILHASAAAGDAVYQLDGTTFRLKSGFEWQLRDTNPAPTPSDVAAFFDAKGWSANTSRAGSPDRRFRIRLDAGLQYLAVTYYATEAPGAISYWPAALSDDCRAVKIAQGYLPETATFHPKTWHALKR